MSEHSSYIQNSLTTSASKEVVLAIQNLSFAYALTPDRNVVEDFSCDVCAGQISLLLGPTGSGKSTILSLIKPEIVPQGRREGSIVVCGQEVSTMTQAQSVDTIAFVQQATSQALVCETPLKELAFGLENRGVSEKEMRRRIFETVSFFGMESLLHKRCNELSGGEQQLVALAAALVMRLKLLLLDEPTRSWIRLRRRVSPRSWSEWRASSTLPCLLPPTTSPRSSTSLTRVSASTSRNPMRSKQTALLARRSVLAAPHQTKHPLRPTARPCLSSAL